MLRFIFSSVVLILSLCQAHAVVFTTLSLNGQHNQYDSQEIKFKTLEGTFKFKLVALQNRVVERNSNNFKVSYFISVIPNEPNNIKLSPTFPKDALLKLRLGNGTILDLKNIREEKFTWRKVDEYKNNLGDIEHTGCQLLVVDPISVWYEVSLDQLIDLSELGIKKIRYYQVNPNETFDFNFSEKQTKSTAKTLSSHFNNLQKKIKEYDTKLKESLQKKKENPTSVKKKEVEEF